MPTGQSGAAGSQKAREDFSADNLLLAPEDEEHDDMCGMFEYNGSSSDESEPVSPSEIQDRKQKRRVRRYYALLSHRCNKPHRRVHEGCSCKGCGSKGVRGPLKDCECLSANKVLLRSLTSPPMPTGDEHEIDQLMERLHGHCCDWCFAAIQYSLWDINAQSHKHLFLKDIRLFFPEVLDQAKTLKDHARERERTWVQQELSSSESD